LLQQFLDGTPYAGDFVYPIKLHLVFEILLAEDNPGDVLLFREALSSCQLPCNVVVATDGQKAIALLGGVTGDEAGSSPSNGPVWQPHLIVLDVNLPKHNGDAVLRHVRRQPRLKGVPVIMLTSSASPADRAAAIDLGANLYLQKSSDLDELLEVGKIVEAILTRVPATERSEPRP
jgi:two-component system, chemotaxis family, response regulator Rcp1